MNIIISKWTKVGLLLALVVQMSCYKDKGNYDLTAINKITITASESDTLQINQFDTLVVRPVLQQSLEDGQDNLTYKWSVYLYNAPVTGVIDEILAETKDLEVQFGLRPDTYTLLYTVTDRNTGVSAFKKYLLQVGSTLSEGWLLISEKKSGQRDVDLLHPEGYIVPNLLSAANPGGEIPANLHTARVLTTFFGSSQDIYLLGENESLRVRYTDFTKMNAGSDWFVERPSLMKPQEYIYDMIGLNAFYIDNGHIYSNQIDFRFGVPIPGEYYFSKYFIAAQSSDAAILYDQLGKKFVRYSNKQFQRFADDPAAPFNMEDVGMDVLFGGPAPATQYSLLMKDNEDVPYVLRIHSGGQAVSKHKVDQAPQLLQATATAFSGLYYHIYYSVANKIYLLDVANNSAKLVYSFPNGTDVRALTLKQSRSSFVGFPDDNRTLAVGTYDGQEGKVYVFSIDNVGEFENQTYSQLYEGLNKPISLEYKNRK